MVSRSAANDASRRSVEMRGSQALWKKWEQAKDVSMTPERAYSTLGVPSKIEDGMLVTIFSISVSSSSTQGTRGTAIECAKLLKTGSICA